MSNPKKNRYEKTIFNVIISSALMLMAFSCDKITPEADYKGVSLYRTKGDYFENVVIWMNKDGKIAGNPAFPLSNLYITETDTTNKFRLRIVDGYVLDFEGTISDAYLSVTYKDYLLWLERYDELAFPDDTIWKYMLDLDPYLEHWRAKDNEAFTRNSHMLMDTVGLKQIILDGRIEEYFTRIKINTIR